MNITIVPEDGTIGIDGEFLLDIEQQYLSWIPENVHAFHWYDDVKKGEIEYKHHPLGIKQNNDIITDLGIFEEAIKTFTEEIERRAQAQADQIAAEEASTDYWQLFRFERSYKLTQSDWTQLSDSPLTEEEKQLWGVYRQELRDLPENIEDPKLLVLDFNHPSWPVVPS
jgi:hypothetical protein